MKSILLLAFIVATSNTIMGQEDDCQDISPKCTENEAAGKCDWKWMKNQCKETCGLCPGGKKPDSYQKAALFEIVAVIADRTEKALGEVKEGNDIAQAIFSKISADKNSWLTAEEKAWMREAVPVLDNMIGQGIGYLKVANET